MQNPIIVNDEKGKEIHQILEVPSEHKNGVITWYKLRYGALRMQIKNAREESLKYYTITWTPWGFIYDKPFESYKKALAADLDLVFKKNTNGKMTYNEFEKFIVAEVGPQLGLYICDAFKMKITYMMVGGEFACTPVSYTTFCEQAKARGEADTRTEETKRKR